MKPNLHFIVNPMVYGITNGSHVKFEYKRYPGIGFYIEVVDGKLKASGFEVVKGMEVTITRRQFSYIEKWLNQNVDEIVHYFSNECDETKLAVTIGGGKIN